ncbi:hypothetical protein EGR_10741 [Echinococcus granulosus]|uniref:Uncharacterized protein n=1 Tax=Echinococcus granulosus TaxID=6210 RepID=W6U048_ECHGR|nr:hypothetical protein EGR_10741 [Echinococcus granulosus]EUB54398.1 hypothetical protein EGR_10741 [Echinococcus granulosus]
MRKEFKCDLSDYLPMSQWSGMLEQAKRWQLSPSLVACTPITSSSLSTVGVGRKLLLTAVDMAAICVGFALE